MPGQTRLNRKRDEAGEVLPTESAMSPEIPMAKMTALRSSPDEWSYAPVTSANRNNRNNELRLDKCGRSKFVSVKGSPAQSKSALQDRNCCTVTDSEIYNKFKYKNPDCTDSAQRQQSPVLQLACKFSSDQELKSLTKILDYNPASVADQQSGETEKDCKLEQGTLILDERSGRKREKRPDIQLYVPKGRQQMLLTKDAPFLLGKLSDVSCVTEPVVTSEGVTVNISQQQKQLVVDDAERRVTMKHESMFQMTILQQENIDVKKVGGPVRKRKQQKSKGRAGDFPSQLDSRIRKKVVHDGRSPWQKHQHKFHASGAGNRTVDDDVSEVEELEWDHQADLDLDQLEIELLAATHKQDSNIDAAQLRNSELQHSGSLEKLAGKTTNKKVQRKHQKGKSVVLYESRMTNEDDLCSLTDKAIKPVSGSLRCENISTIAGTDLTNRDENFDGKFDLLVITNSRKSHSPSIEGTMHQYGNKHEYDNSQPLHVGDGIVNAGDNHNSTQLKKPEKLKMQNLKKNVRDLKSFGTKYDSSRSTDTYKTHITTFEIGQNSRTSIDSIEKADKNSAHELQNENPPISDKNISTRVGGIIRLPAGTTTTSVFLKPDHTSSYSRHTQQHGIKGHARCRAATQRTLWDPSQPIKGAAPSPNKLLDVSEHLISEANVSREYEHVVQTPKLQLTPHPYYGSLTSFGQSMPVENYNYCYPGPPCFDVSSYDGSLMNDLYFLG